MKKLEFETKFAVFSSEGKAPQEIILVSDSLEAAQNDFQKFIKKINKEWVEKDSSDFYKDWQKSRITNIINMAYITQISVVKK